MISTTAVQELFESKQDVTLASAEGEHEAVLMNFDGPEGKGQIVVERGGYGAYIWVNGQCLALVDLFSFSPEHKNGCEPGDEQDYPQIVFYQPEEDDALGHVRWLSGRTDIYVERNPVELSTDTLGKNLTYYLDKEK